MDAQVSLGSRLESATMARRFAESTLHEWGVDETSCETTRLLVSELVANAVTHAGSDAVLDLRLHGGVLRVEVTDAAPGHPVRRDPGPDELSGRGLLIVDALADRWGVELRPPGKTVWFELSTDDHARA